MSLWSGMGDTGEALKSDAAAVRMFKTAEHPAQAAAEERLLITDRDAASLLQIRQVTTDSVVLEGTDSAS